MGAKPPGRRRPLLRTTRPRANPGGHSAAMVRPSWQRGLRQMLRSGRLAALMLVLASVAGLIFVFRSDRFRVRQIEISGNRSLSSAAVTELAGISNSSIWSVNSEAIAARINQNPYVAQSVVTALLPDRVVIRILEHEAAILWQVDGINYEVSDTGAVLGAASTITSTVLLIHDTRHAPLASGQFIDADALALVQTLNLRLPAEQGWTPTRYEWDPYYGISVYSDSRQIALGRMTDSAVPLDTKLDILNTLRTDQTWTFLDLRSTKPYYRQALTPEPTETP